MYYTKIIDDDDMNNEMLNYIENTSSFDTSPNNNFFSGEVMINDNNKSLGFLSPSQQFVKLKKYVEKFCKEKTREVLEHPDNGYKNFTKLEKLYVNRTHVRNMKCINLWVTRSVSSNYITPHHHWPHVWGFTYYLNPPKGAKGLYFPNHDKEVELQHGLLILFNGDELHEVKPSTYEGYRYCIAGNLMPVIND